MEQTIFHGKNLEELAIVFADVVCRHHVAFLEMNKATAMDDTRETAYWNYRIENEPKIVKEVTYKRILDMMQHPDQNRVFLKKKKLFGRYQNMFEITAKGGFYEKILAESKVYVPVNVEYIIDIENFSIDKISHNEEG